MTLHGAASDFFPGPFRALLSTPAKGLVEPSQPPGKSYPIGQWCTTSSPRATSGPRRVVKWPCPAGKVIILGFALQKMENARRKPSWILFRLLGLSIQDETEVLPTARRLRTFYSFRYFPVTYVYLQQTRTSIQSATCIFGCRSL